MCDWPGRIVFRGRNPLRSERRRLDFLSDCGGASDDRPVRLVERDPGSARCHRRGDRLSF